MNAAQTLGALIRDRQASTGWSYRDLAQRSPAGTGLNKSRWGELRRDEAKTFSGAQLLGMAEALGVPESIVGRAALATMGVTAHAGSAARVEDAVRNDNDLSEHDRRILLAVLREMRTERGGNAVSTAPIIHAGESPATDQEDSERQVEGSSLSEVHRAPREVVGVAGQAGEDEVARRREAMSTVTADSDVESEVPGQEEIPVPDEELMAGYDAPQESILAREQQDADAEGPQD